MAENQILKAKQILIDEKIYPRNSVNDLLVYKYTQAMKAGAKFPPITVALYRNKYYLLDGRHRLNAKMKCGEKYVQAEIISNLTKEQMYVEAVRRNMCHGQMLNSNEVTRAITRMREMKISRDEISKIINMPVANIEPFVAKRITNTATGKIVFLKKGVTNMHGSMISDETATDINGLSGLSQKELFADAVTIVKNGLLQTTNSQVMKPVKELYSLLDNFFFGVSVTKRKRKTTKKHSKKTARKKHRK
jgi:hypothetical protein